MPDWPTVALALGATGLGGLIGVGGTVLATRLQHQHARSERLATERRDDTAKVGGVLAVLAGLLDEGHPDSFIHLAREGHADVLERFADIQTRMAAADESLRELHFAGSSPLVRERVSQARSAIGIAMAASGGLAFMGPLLMEVPEGVVRVREKAIERLDTARESLDAIAEAVRST